MVIKQVKNVLESDYQESTDSSDDSDDASDGNDDAPTSSFSYSNESTGQKEANTSSNGSESEITTS